MPKQRPPTLLELEFFRRVRKAREDADYTQEKIATLLHMKQDKYSKYENRSLMPHEYIWPFCIATHISADKLFANLPEDIPAQSRRVRRKKSAAKVHGLEVNGHIGQSVLDTED
jgi:transcriptional regulator with XRE-family HTH domain